MYVYAVIDFTSGPVAVCDGYCMAYVMATDYVRENYDCEWAEECENVWIEEITLNEWL